MIEGQRKHKNPKTTPKVRKQPLRHCIGCAGEFLKKDLIRVVRSPEGDVSIDFTGKKSGRGAYICKNEQCLKKARKSGALHRHLEVEITDDLYAQLEKEIKFEMERAGD